MASLFMILNRITFVLCSLCRVCCSVVNHGMDEIRHFCYWLVLRMPSKRQVSYTVFYLVVLGYLHCLTWTFATESNTVNKYATEIFLQRHVSEGKLRASLEEEQVSGVYRRYVGEDASFRCVIPISNVGFYAGYQMAILYSNWYKKQDKHTYMQHVFDTPQSHIETAYDSAEQYIYTQLDLINIDDKDLDIGYICVVYDVGVESDIFRKIFYLQKIPETVNYIYEPRGSFVQLNPSFISVESTIYGPPSVGFEVNGIGFGQFDNTTTRCSPWINFAKGLITRDGSETPLSIIQHYLQSPTIDTSKLVWVSTFPLLSDREPLSDFNVQTKTWMDFKTCMDDHRHGVVQFYFDRQLYNDTSGKHETVRVYYPRTWVFNPNGANDLLHPEDTLGKEEHIETMYDSNYVNFMKKKLRLMHSSSGFNSGVWSFLACLTVEEIVYIFTPASYICILSSVFFSLRFIFIKLNGFFIRLLREKRVERRKDDRKDVYILCSEDGLGWTCQHVLSPLEKRGLQTWILHRDVLPGSPKIAGALAGVEQCIKIIMVLDQEFAIDGIYHFYLRSLATLVAEGILSADNVVIINKNGRKEQIELLQHIYNILPINSLCLSEMTERCLTGLYNWIMRI